MSTRQSVSDLISDANALSAFTKAVQALKSTRRSGSVIPIYDEFVAVHLGVTRRFRNGMEIGDGGHGGPAFLAWHRVFIRHFEQALQSVDPNVTLPWWPWGDATVTNEMFTDKLLGPLTGTITSGPFSPTMEFVVDRRLHGRRWNDDEANTFGSALRRGPSRAPRPTDNDIESILTESTANGFRRTLEGFHNDVHVWVGGSMRRMTSPNDPVFFMHHAMVDRLWAMWQEHGHEGTTWFPTDNARQGHRIGELMWPWDDGGTTILPGLLALIPNLESDDLWSPELTLNYRAMGYDYDLDQGSLPLDRTGRSATIAALGDMHSYRVEVTQRGRYHFEANSQDSGIAMSLYDTSPTSTRIVQSANGSNAVFTIELDPGDYRIVVHAGLTVSIGAYQVSAQAVDRNGNTSGSLSEFPRVRILEVDALALSAAIGTPGEIDWYSFDITTNGTYRLETTGNTDVQIFLFRDNGTDPVAWDDDSGEGVNARIFRSLDTGRYRASVRHYNPNATGSYSIRITDVAT